MVEKVVKYECMIVSADANIGKLLDELHPEKNCTAIHPDHFFTLDLETTELEQLLIEINNDTLHHAEKIFNYLEKSVCEKVVFYGEKSNNFTAPLAGNLQWVHIPLPFSSLSLEVITHYFELKKTQTASESEIKSLNEKVKFQAVMLQELEQTNNNLISATWRERELKRKLTMTLDELQKSKQLIEIQNKKISESINYSRKIQNVILPDEYIIRESLDAFILYIPKDVVSGDFPFYYLKGNDIYLAAADCTGHGVPGAMLSLIAYLTLNDVIHTSEGAMPSEILNKLHYGIVKTLKQDIKGNDTSDGMDIALCRINTKENTLYFSGAHRHLLHIRNNQLMEYKGTRLPIGGTQYKKAIEYTNHVVPIQKGDSIYFFSDGYQDQFGGPDKEKFGLLRIQHYLLHHQHLSTNEIKEGLKAAFSEWKGEDKQMDDILFMGVKF